MNPLDRINLIKEIAVKLQEQFTTTEINLFLAGYGIKGLTETMVNSKRVYSQQILQEESNETISKVARDLSLDAPKAVQPERKQDIVGTNEKKVFISHSSKDANVVEQVIELLEAIGLNENQIFCTSFEGYNIKIGTDWLQTLKEELNKEVLVIFILSENFYNSPVSLCEMGATWVKTSEHIPVLIPPFSYAQIQGVIPNTQGMKINEKAKLNSLKEKVEAFFSLTPKNFSVWERKRDNAVGQINEIITVTSLNDNILDVNEKFEIITEKKAGDFELKEGMLFPSSSDNFKVKSEKISRMTEEGPTEEDYYVISQNGTEMLNVRTSSGKSQFVETIEEILVLTENFRTKEGIGVGSTIAEFTKAYPNYYTWYTYVSEMYVIESKDLHIQFILPKDSYKGGLEINGDMTELNISDFDQEAKIMKVRLISNKC
ncbi:toll/interleukin-1 receptor domain-containing protein [Rapidithrix thailandica]|uniref:Toll/interleukin-1 receptor domain-containing protein n=1 Tax=Rapidithrix thailandica TaxID=413964 RepID=A0AAW9S9H3_9BACT